MSDSTVPKPFEFPAQVVPTSAEPQPRILLGGIDIYTDAIKKFRDQIFDLVRQGTMSEQTAARIILEHEYSFFQQLIQVEYQTVKEQG